MLDYFLEPYTEEDQDLGEEYAQWLDDYCKCTETGDTCVCLSFEDWLHDRECACVCEDYEDYA